MKKTKKNLLIIVLVAIVFVASYFTDKSYFDGLKDIVIKKVDKISSKIIKENEKTATASSNTNLIDLNNDFMVLFIDVGQGDCTLIKSQKEYMLVDAGNNKDGEKLVAFFKDLGIKEFKYVVGTHAHEDHIGGMDDIIKNFKVKNFYMPDEVTTTETFLEVLNALESKNIAFKVPIINDKLKLGKSTVDVIYVGKDKEDLNDTSIILKVTYKNTSFLLTGDTTSNTEKEIFNSNIESTVLKVAHHGSKYSSSAQFLNTVKPKYAVISCGKNNDYYHPHQVVLDKLQKLKAKVYRTDKKGTIIAISDGEKIEFKTVKTDTKGE